MRRLISLRADFALASLVMASLSVFPDVYFLRDEIALVSELYVSVFYRQLAFYGLDCAAGFIDNDLRLAPVYLYVYFFTTALRCGQLRLYFRCIGGFDGMAIAIYMHVVRYGFYPGFMYTGVPYFAGSFRAISVRFFLTPQACYVFPLRVVSFILCKLLLLSSCPLYISRSRSHYSTERIARNGLPWYTPLLLYWSGAIFPLYLVQSLVHMWPDLISWVKDRGWQFS